MFSSYHLHMLVVTLLIAGGVNWGLVGAVKFNIVNKIFGKFDRVVYIAVGLAALYLALNRNTYLPFLGETAIPPPLSGAYREGSGENKVEVANLPPGSQVVYWAASAAATGKNVAENPVDAYADYANAGVTTADKDGKAVFALTDKPGAYKVPPFGRVIKPHVHYRYWGKKYGIASEVKTVYL